MVTVRADFRADLRNLLVTSLVADGYDIGTTTEVDDLLALHVNVQMRKISTLHRPVLWSQELRARNQSLSQDQRDVLAGIELVSHRGGDLTPYLSRKLVGRDKEADFTDHLLCDWDIHHLHLGKGRRRGIVRSSKEVLFVVARNDALYFIDILDHTDPDSFAEQQVFDAVVTNWPHLFERYRMPTIARSAGPRLSAADRRTFRNKGGNALTIGPDGGAYLPIGGGIMTNSVSSRVRTEVDRVISQVDSYQQDCVQHAQEIADKIFAATGRRLETLDLKLRVVEKNGMSAVETQSNVVVNPAGPTP